MVIDLSCVSSPADNLQVGPSALQNGIFHLWRVLAENTLVRDASTVVDFGRPRLVHGIAVLFKICPCLCSGPVLSHLVVIFLHILACTLRFSFLYGDSNGGTSSCVPSLSAFSAKSQCKCFAVGQQRECGVCHRIVTTCFGMRSSKCLPTGLQPSTPTHDVH